jgi:primosomal protein N' (replication factor Y)
MLPFTIVKVAIPAPLHKLFDYLLPEAYADKADSLIQGIRVQVPFGRRQVLGFIVSIDDKTTVPLESLKPITAILDDVPLLPPVLMQLIKWTSQYYHYPLGEVMETAFPARLRKLKSVAPRKSKSTQEGSHEAILAKSEAVLPTLNEEQKQVFDAIRKGFSQFGVFLLEGVTGSGKTEVYLQLIQQMLNQAKQVLLLVPEISLTPQMVARLQQRLGDNIVLSHSGLSDPKRLLSWQAVKTGEKFVMVGTRSAVFTPFKALGLIIIDEEHDGSFKQQEGLSYNARDVAIMRARLEKVPIVLGSATPALESVWNAAQGRYHKLSLSKRAGTAVLPAIQVMDVRKRRLHAGLSEELLALMGKHLQTNSQILLFLNRRGFASIYLCHGCGWIMMCSQCDSPLRLHHRPLRLRCHYCEQGAPVPSECPNCHQEQLFALGQGTQRLEEILASYFPGIQSIRIDADSTRGKDQLTRLLADIRKGGPGILIGTQILAKGHHFPGVSLAVIVEGDAGLFGTDFRSLEKAAQLMMQVGGRAGRGHQAGQVIIQTHHPNHPLLNQLIETGYAGFSQLALQERRKAGWPPFNYLALLRVDARRQKTGLDFLQQVKRSCILNPSVTLLGPVPALLAKRAGYYRSQLLLKSAERAALHEVLQSLVLVLEAMPKRGIHYRLEVDPLEICSYKTRYKL